MNPYPVLPIGADYRTSRGISGFTRVVGRGGETLHCFAPVYRKHDFLGAAKLLTDELQFLEGSDTAATGAVSAGINGGVFRLTTAAAAGTTYSVDGCQITCGLNLKASLGGLLFEARVRSNTAVTARAFGCGFTDNAALEEPASVSGTTQTTTATDAAVFVYDTNMTTDTIWASAVNTDVDTSAYDTSAVPVADTFDIYRIEANAAGDTQWYLNDVLKKEVSAAFSPTVLMTPIVWAMTRAAAAKVIDIDYMLYAGCRL